MYFSSTPKTYEPEESDFENALYELKIHDNILPKVTHTKFLGVIIDDRLSWDHHIKGAGGLHQNSLEIDFVVVSDGGE